MLIWSNECSKRYDQLVFWKQNEKFPSLGICHFIWYPKKSADIYTQTFPDLLTYFKKKKVQLPAWLKSVQYAPWKTKEEFDAAAQSKEIEELRQLLYQTMDLQVEFLIERLQKSWPRILKSAAPEKRKLVQQNFQALMQTPEGTFALLDYLNFKGEGIDQKERYNGAGWGLLQVLEGMAVESNGKVDLSVRPESAKDQDRILESFITSAQTVLTNRIANAPAHKAHEKEWLKGWINRVNRYKHGIRP